jgi:hypothetical protein
VKHEKRLELTEVNGVEAPPRFRGELSVGLPIWKRLESLPRAAQLDAAEYERPMTDAETRGWV